MYAFRPDLFSTKVWRRGTLQTPTNLDSHMLVLVIVAFQVEVGYNNELQCNLSERRINRNDVEHLKRELCNSCPLHWLGL